MRELSSRWKGGISFEPYCKKFNNAFKERVREYFGRTCTNCGRPEHENKVRSGKVWRLSVHHVNYDKQVCCNSNNPWFVSLCISCHSLTNTTYYREWWEEYFSKIIEEKYKGKCFYTKEEFKEIMDYRNAISISSPRIGTLKNRAP